MENDVDIPDLEGYVSVKEAAEMLDVSPKRVHAFINTGRLEAKRVVNAYIIPIHAIENFQRKASGRERKVTPLWRFSTGENTQYMTYIAVEILPGRETALKKRLQEIKRSGKHIFPGTIARYFCDSQTTPGWVEIVLIWRGTVMPDEATRQQELEAFKQALADVLDWRTAQYNDSKILMHT